MFLIQRLVYVLLGLGALASCSDDSTTSNTTSGSTVGYTISGTISAAPQTMVDSDVNDPNAPYTANDTLGSAQTLPNPAIVGGYVNRPGMGESGRSQTLGDVTDTFSAELKAGQSLHLFVASDDLRRNDVDMVLLDSSGTVIDAAVSKGESETLSVARSGKHFIQLRAHAGASNYVLTIGQDIRNLAVSSAQLSAEFAPGDVLVEWKSAPSAATPAWQTQAATTQLHALGLQTEATDGGRRMKYTLDMAQTPLTQSVDDLAFASAAHKEKYLTLMTVKSLSRLAEVESASVNRIYRVQRTPNDSLYRYQWHYPAMYVPQAWDITQGDAAVIVAVVDTGVLVNHPDLQGKIAYGYDFVSDRSIAMDGNGLDSNPDDPGSFSGGTGTNFHGSHVAGTIGAATGNGSGVAGVGWNTTIMPLRALGKDGGGTEYDIEQAIRYAAGLSNDSGKTPGQRADVINLSLGGPSPPDSNAFQNLINDVRRAGVIVVAASGNEGAGRVNYPAALNGVVAVGAVTINRQRAHYSNYGAALDLTAPGGDNATDVNGDGIPDGVISTLGDNSQNSVRYIYDYAVGTSMAAPHVAGVIALMKAVYPGMRPDELDALLSRGDLTDDLGDSGFDSQYGHGLMNAHKAVQAALQLASGGRAQPVAVLSVAPASINFGATNTRIPLQVSNAGSAALAITRITEDSGGHLNLSRSTDVDGNGMGTYYAVLDRSGQSAGTYTANLVFIAGSQRVTVPVIWQVDSTGRTSTGNAGRQFVLLVDPITLDSVKEQQVNAANGQYAFKFTGVNEGSYIMVAGSDHNNNFTICDAGESCGAYLTLDKPTEIGVNRNLSGVNFSVNFNTNFLSLSAASEGIPAPRRGFARQPLHHLPQ